MKYSIVFALLIASVFAACSSENTTKNVDASTVQVTPVETVDSSNVTAITEEPLAEGAKLMKSTDCYSCHNEDANLVGPSFKKIAEKYSNTKNNNASLIEKVIKGGQGVWGQVPMQAHPTLAKDDAAKMVTYILSLK